MKKRTRGGRRAGAGRPALPAERRRVARTITMSRETLAGLEAIALKRGLTWGGKPNRPAALEQLVSEELERMAPD